MTSGNTPPYRLTMPADFPDLDAALAACGIARKASAPCRTVEDPEESETYAVELVIDADERSGWHPAAVAGAVLGLVLIGLLVFSVVRVSHDSIQTATPLKVPASANAPTPVAATAPLAAVPSVTPPTPDAAASQNALAAPAASPPPPPAALFDASTVTAQTMVAEPPPQSEIAPEGSLLSRLHERFPQLFPAP